MSCKVVTDKKISGAWLNHKAGLIANYVDKDNKAVVLGRYKTVGDGDMQSALIFRSDGTVQLQKPTTRGGVKFIELCSVKVAETMAKFLVMVELDTKD